MHRRGVPGTGVQAAVAADHDRLVPALHVDKPQSAIPRLVTAGQIWHSRSGELVAYGGCDLRGWWMTWPHLATYRFSPNQSHIVAHPDPDAPVDVIWDTYRRSVLPMAMQAAGSEALHASAVRCTRGVVTFCAVSETGKSSVAYGLSRRGFAQWADDAVVLSAGAPMLSIPLPFEVRLRNSASGLFHGPLPVPLRFARNGPGDQRHETPASVHAICVLERQSGRTAPELEPMAPAEAFRGLLTHAHEFNPNDSARRAAMLESYLTIVAAAPVYRVTFDATGGSIEPLLDTIVTALSLQPSCLEPAAG